MSENNKVNYFSAQDSPLEQRIARIIRLLAYVGMAICFAMAFLTVVHGFGRYLFGRPITGNVELASFMLVTFIFLLGAYVMMLRGHIVMTLIVDRFSERTQAVINFFAYLLCLGFAVLAAWRTVVWGIDMFEAKYVTMTLHMPHFPFIFVVAFGWGIFALATALHLVRFILKAVRGVKQ